MIVRRSIPIALVLWLAAGLLPAMALAECDGDGCGMTADPWSAVGPLLLGVVIVALACGMAVSEARARR